MNSRMTSGPMIELDYTNESTDWVAQFEAGELAVMSQLRFRHYSWIGYWCVMAGLAIYVSLLAELVFMAALFGGMLLNYVVRAVPFSRLLQPPPGYGGSKRIHLTVSDAGLRELVDGQVESFVPWSGVQRFVATKDHVFIEMAGHLWANIPRASVEQGPAAVDELVATLRSRGIQE